jgi:hypothetical protein
MLDAALAYARRGWEVFPVPPGTKAGYSIKKRGFDAGTSWGKTADPDIIHAYWRRLPRANIGVAMGTGSGIWDLECDTAEGHANLKQDGATSLAELESDHGKLPPTAMFVSPSGSVHRLFRHPGGDFRVAHLISKLGPGIDVIGDGFMSVMPPSIKPRGGRYEWLDKHRIAKAPQWLLDMVRVAPRNRGADNCFQAFAREFDRPASIEELTLAMAMIPNDDLDWDQWNKVAMALHAATGGSADGLALFDAWSQRSSKYDGSKTQEKWEKLTRCPPNEIGVRSIFHWADRAVPDWKERLREPEVYERIVEFGKLMGES